MLSTNRTPEYRRLDALKVFASRNGFQQPQSLASVRNKRSRTRPASTVIAPYRTGRPLKNWVVERRRIIRSRECRGFVRVAEAGIGRAGRGTWPWTLPTADPSIDPIASTSVKVGNRNIRCQEEAVVDEHYRRAMPKQHSGRKSEKIDLSAASTPDLVVDPVPLGIVKDQRAARRQIVKRQGRDLAPKISIHDNNIELRALRFQEV